MRCRVCGKEFSRDTAVSPTLCSSECFEVSFWVEKLVWKLNGDRTPDGAMVARIRGQHFVIPAGHSAGFQGVAGHEFVIAFIAGPHNGLVVITRDLWHQGDIPPRFRAQLSDNAVFLDGPSQVARSAKVAVSPAGEPVPVSVSGGAPSGAAPEVIL
ncbi:MAG: hypothetical protein NUW23_12480 [Firmicutes bacterium]|jgi:hypothetical protein|nr:hypothetical protein [Bacillota bacterium]